MDRQVTVRFSLGSVIAVLAVLLGLWVASQMPHLLVELFLALVVASALRPGVHHLERRFKGRRSPAVIVMFLGVLGVLGLLAALVVPPFVDQATQLSSTLPQIGTKLSGQYDALRAHAGPLHYLPARTSLVSSVGQGSSAIIGQGLDWAKRTLTAVTAILVVLVVAFFVMLDGPLLRRGGLALVPRRFRPIVDAQLDPIATKLGLYVQGSLLSIGFFILYQSVALSLAGLPLALGVAVVAGILEIIPVLGTAVGLVLSLAVAASISGKMVLIVLAIFAVGRAIQDNFVNPYVFSRSLEMPPSLVIVSLLVGAELMGIEGALISMPLLAAVQVLVQNLYVDRMASPGPLAVPLAQHAAGEEATKAPDGLTISFLRQPPEVHLVNEKDRE